MNSGLESKKRKSREEKTKLDFPEWDILIRKTNMLFQENKDYRNPEIDKRMDYYLSSMDDFRIEYLTNPLNVLFNFAYGLLKITKENFISGIPSEEAISTLKSMPIGANEFYTLFEVKVNEYTIVDPRIGDVLGVEPEDFNFMGILGVKPNALQIHPADLCHLSRSALIAYMVICTPGFKWKAMHDYYRARARVNVSRSKIKEVEETRWLTLEKEVYMGHQETKEQNFIPVYHFKRWKVYPESEYAGTRPYFGGDPYQSKFRNAYWYLLHAYMLDIPVKFILLLHERQTKDRHKAIALAISSEVRKYHPFITELDEGQVADCFAKTIRQKIGEAMSKWENRSTPMVISSDIEATTCAQTLGLLPIPHVVLDLIYKHTVEV
ncbi:MAG: hypothetical protein ACKVOK_00585 [Flavobacteriales bacterium]